MSAGNAVTYTGGYFVQREPYVPLVIAGATPVGGGTTLENINLLTALRRMDFSADGTSTAYVLPAEAIGVTRILIDNIEYAVETAGSYDGLTHTFTFNNAPVKGGEMLFQLHLPKPKPKTPAQSPLHHPLSTGTLPVPTDKMILARKLPGI